MVIQTPITRPLYYGLIDVLQRAQGAIIQQGQQFGHRSGELDDESHQGLNLEY